MDIENIENTLVRIRNMIAYGLTLDEIHEMINPSNTQEESLFFLCYLAAQSG